MWPKPSNEQSNLEIRDLFLQLRSRAEKLQSTRHANQNRELLELKQDCVEITKHLNFLISVSKKNAVERRELYSRTKTTWGRVVELNKYWNLGLFETFKGNQRLRSQLAVFLDL